VVVFDLKTLKVTGEIKAAPDADAILYDPASKRIFSFIGDAWEQADSPFSSFGFSTLRGGNLQLSCSSTELAQM
jgi:hypothetical protein